MNKTIMTIWTITAVIILAIGYFVLYPGINQGLETLKQTRQANTDLANSSQKKQALSDVSQNNNLDQLTNIATHYIPEDNQSGELILEVTAIAAKANINVDQISLQSQTSTVAVQPSDTSSQTTAQTSTANKPKEVGFQMKLSGDFNNLLTFLKLSENSARLISIQSVNLGQTNGKLSADLNGNGYWQAKTNNNTQDLGNIIVTKETIAKLQNLTLYSPPIMTPSQAGFGRTNPFDAIN